MARTTLLANSEYLDGSLSANPWSALPVSLGLWINVQAFLNGDAAYGFGGDLSSDLISLQVRATGGMRFLVTSEAGSCIFSSGMSVNVWHFILATVDASGNMDLRLDGSSQATDTGAALPGTVNNVRIGVRPGGLPDANFGSVTVAECTAWNVVIGAADEDAMVDGVSPRMIQPQAQVFYDPMIRGADSFDLVGGVTLVDNNTVTVSDHPPIFYPASPFIITAPAAVGGDPEGPLVGGKLVGGGILAGRLVG